MTTTPDEAPEQATAAPAHETKDGVFEAASAALCEAAATAQRAIERNPALAVAGAAAATAVIVLALRQQRAATPETRQIAREVRRQARAVTAAVRDELDARGASTAWSDLTRTLSSLDLKPYLDPYLKPLADEAARVASEAKSQIAAAVK